MYKLSLVGLLSLFSVSCASLSIFNVKGSMIEVVKHRSSYELKCDESKIEVIDIGGTSFIARGCKKEKTYNCFHHNGEITCLRERIQDEGKV